MASPPQAGYIAGNKESGIDDHAGQRQGNPFTLGKARSKIMTLSIDDVIRSRRSVRFFKEGDAINKADLKDLLEAARQAPSAKNLQPIEYVLVDNANVKNALSTACRQNQPSQAPAVIVVLGNMQISSQLSKISVSPNSTSYRSTHMFIYMDAAAAIENMLLAATAKGIDSLWISSFDDKAVHDALQLPEHLEPFAIICFGHRARPPFSPKKRSIDERLYHNHYRPKSQDFAYLEQCKLINSIRGEYAR